MKKRQPAFTIMELLVTMTLTSLLVLAAWYAFELIQKQYVLQKQMNKEISTYIQLETRLTQDAEQAIFLKKQLQKLIFKQAQNVIEYDFQSDFVIRKNDLSLIEPDTFFIQTNLKESSLNGQEEFEGMVDRVVIQLFPFRTEQIFTLKKQYSTADLMNRNNYTQY